MLGFVNAIDQPVRQSFVVELVGREDVGNAVALNSASFNAARIVGPAVAGVLIARFGVAPAFALNARGFAAMIVVAAQAARPWPAARRGAGTTIARGDRRGRSLRAEAAGDAGRARARRGGEPLRLQLQRVRAAPRPARCSVSAPRASASSWPRSAWARWPGALTVGARRRSSRSAASSPSPPSRSAASSALSAVRHFWTAVPFLFITGFFGIMVMAGGNARLQAETPARCAAA